MRIRFSRHARRRHKLYGIRQDDVIRAIESDSLHPAIDGGRREFISFDFVEEYGFPLFIVYTKDGPGFEVITNFPYDKDTNYEDIIR
jgi:hypothetical protein